MVFAIGFIIFSPLIMMRITSSISPYPMYDHLGLFFSLVNMVFSTLLYQMAQKSFAYEPVSVLFVLPLIQYLKLMVISLLLSVLFFFLFFIFIDVWLLNKS